MKTKADLNLVANMKSLEEPEQQYKIHLALFSPTPSCNERTDIAGENNELMPRARNNLMPNFPLNFLLETSPILETQDTDLILETTVKIKVLLQFSHAKVLAVAKPIVDEPMLDLVGLTSPIMGEVTTGFAEAMATTGVAKVLAEGEEEMMDKFQVEILLGNELRE
jgi:hypothetical protein